VISITLPWMGSSACNVHANGNWRAKAASTKTHREIAYVIAASSHRPKEPLPQAKIHYVFFVPDNRQRDEANMIQACKPYLDGIVDAKVIDGDNWQRLSTGSVSVEIDKANPRIVLIFEAK